MDTEINNVIYMELYSGPKMEHDKYEKTNVARSIDGDSTVLCIWRDVMAVWKLCSLASDVSLLYRLKIM
jgi:hypothetical protein